MSSLTRLALLSVTAFVLGGCAVLSPTSESLDWDVGNFVFVRQEKLGWKGIRGNESLRLTYVNRGETLENWTEKAESSEWPIAVTLGGSVHWNPVSFMNADKADMQKMGCSTDTWTVLQQNDTSILYELPNIKCSGFLPQHVITRIVMGRWYLWFMQYAIRNKTLSADKRAALIDNLMKAKVANLPEQVR